jgi:tetratricopeptide (TPR) repeat protein
VPGWIGAAVEEALPRSLVRLGRDALAGSDRRRALEGFGIVGPVASRATGIRVAEAVGARYVVAGSWDLAGGELKVALRPLDTRSAALGDEVRAAGPLDDLGRLIDELARALAGASAGAAAEPPAAGRFAALRGLGEALLARDAPARIEGLKRALAAQPGLPDVALVLARQLYDAGRFAEAREVLAALPPAVPFAREARFLDGACLLGLGRPTDADVLYADLAAADPTPGVLANRAVARLRMWPAAAGASTLLRQAVERAPFAAELPFALGWALFVEGDQGESVTWLRSAVRYAPGDAKARLALGWALRPSHPDEADEQGRAAAALDPSLEPLRLSAGAKQHFERVLPSESALLNDVARAADAKAPRGKP